MSLFFVTGNAHKLAEVKAILPQVEQLALDVPEIQSLDSHDVIRAKLEAACTQRPGDSFIVEDTSLCFDCLGGLPGPFVKFFEQALGRAGLAQLALRSGNAKATARTMIGYLPAAGQPVFFEGTIKGTIVAPRGESGFGWDPLFVPDGFDKTFAELGSEVKNTLSMRRKAVEQLKVHLKDQ